MDTTQRHHVRDHLIAAGFDRTGFSDDISGVGDYTETWTHADGTTIDLNWAPRDTTRTAGNRWRAALDQVIDRAEVRRPRPDDSSGSITPEVLASAAAQVQHIVSAPGMYDEPDSDLDLPVAVSDEEDRITSGAPTPTDGIDASKHPHPALIAAFEGKQTTFTVTVEKSDDNGRSELTGYPVDVWRYTESALAVRVAFDKPTTAYAYGVRALDGTDYIVLPDNREWTATSTDGTALSHTVHDHWL